MSKPNCYECQHIGDGFPGNAHPSCVHPEVKSCGDSASNNLMALFASVGRGLPCIDLEGAEKLGINANPHGIRNGWFNWPLDFDPVWLLACDGFEERSATNEQKTVAPSSEAQ